MRPAHLAIESGSSFDMVAQLVVITQTLTSLYRVCSSGSEIRYQDQNVYQDNELVNELVDRGWEETLLVQRQFSLEPKSSR